MFWEESSSRRRRRITKESLQSAGARLCIVALSEVACSRETADSIELLLSDKEVNKRTAHKENTHPGRSRAGELSGSSAGCDHLPAAAGGQTPGCGGERAASGARGTNDAHFFHVIRSRFATCYSRVHHHYYYSVYTSAMMCSCSAPFLHARGVTGRKCGGLVLSPPRNADEQQETSPPVNVRT